MTENNNGQPQQIQLTQQQIAQAAAKGVALLNDDERVNVPPSMAKSGDFSILDSVLSSLARGETVVINMQMAQEYEALKKAAAAGANDED